MTPTEIHELNRVLAEVCGIEIQECKDSNKISLAYQFGPDRKWHWATWSPCADANQMELIKAKLREMGAEYVFEWDNDIVAHDVTLISKKGGMYYGGRHQSELIAFAIAVVAWWEESGK